MKLLVTVDTNELDAHRIDRLGATLFLPHEIAYVTVSRRERCGHEHGMVLGVSWQTFACNECRWGNAAWGGPVAEMLVLDESPLGQAVLADSAQSDVLEDALAVISAGSFPPRCDRETLSAGQRRQLRDAMIFEAHVREHRHVLVTEDIKGFIKDGRRDTLELLGRTRIMTMAELEEHAAANRLESLLPPSQADLPT